MFRSKAEPIVFSQFEHLRLSGELALLWGNRDFDPPPIPRGSFVAGVGLHDRGYGLIDDSPIGGMADSEWMAIARRGFAMRYSDPVADLIAKYHVRRLAGHGDSGDRRALAAGFSAEIDRLLGEHGFARDVFDRIDQITNLCDRISFDFCFGEPAQGMLPVHPRNGESAEIEVSYRVEAECINLDPWPLSVDSHESYLIAYRVEGYPQVLDPVMKRWRVAKA